MSSTLARLSLVIALAGAAQLAAAPAPCFAAAKKKHKKAKKTAAAPEAKKVTAQSILQMHKQGLTDDEIVARAEKQGYKLSTKDRATLKKGHAPKSLIGALDPQGATAAAASEPATTAPAAATVVAEKKPEPINIHKVTDPNDIDFDSVPPPKGIPKQYAQHQEAAPKKQLDRSTRPSAPFDEKEEAAKKTTVASASSSGGSGSTGGEKRRVVYTNGTSN